MNLNERTTRGCDLSLPQVGDERLRADCVHVRVGPVPPGGAALGLGLDLVVHLPRGGLLLLLGPPLRSRYQHTAQKR